MSGEAASFTLHRAVKLKHETAIIADGVYVTNTPRHANTCTFAGLKPLSSSLCVRDCVYVRPPPDTLTHSHCTAIFIVTGHTHGVINVVASASEQRTNIHAPTIALNAQL